MANYTVRSAAGGTGDGSSWANAYTTLAAAMTGKAAGDIFWVADDHAETQASAMTMTCPGTAATPCQVLCVSDAAYPPTTLASTATITTTGTNAMNWTGCAYVYGITFQCGTGTSAAHMTIGSGTASAVMVFDTCRLELLSTSTSSRIYLSGAGRDTHTTLYNSVLKFSSTGQRLYPRGRLVWIGGSLDTSAAIPTQLFNTEIVYGGMATIQGVNLSSLNTSLVLVGSGSPYRYYFRNCRLHASVTAIAATACISEGAEQVFVDNCDSGDTNYKMDHRKYGGSIVTETTVIRTGGASDGTTGFSWKMVSLTTPQFFWPLESPPMAIWNDTTGSELTLTVEIVHDSLTNIQDDEIWVEVEYLGTSGYPLSLNIIDRMTDILSTAADQTDSSVAWTTTGLTNPNTQKLVATFTPQEKGLIVAKVMLAKPSYTVYVCPKVTVA